MSFINIDVKAELELFDVEKKFNDYIGMQKSVLSILRGENFFDNNVVTNIETGMTISITAKGIKETLGSGMRFQNLPRDLKRLKVATIHSLPQIIKYGKLIEDEVNNKHGENYRFAYFMTPVKMDNQEMFVKVSVRKSLQTNKFWVHNVIIEKSSETLNPNQSQDIHERQNFS